MNGFIVMHRKTMQIRQLCLTFAYLLQLLAAQQVFSSPWIPQSDDEVIATLPNNYNTDSAEIKELRDKLIADPNNERVALALCQHYLHIAKATQDSRYYGYIQAILQPWWDTPQPPVAVLEMRVKVKQYFHAFTSALDDLTQLIHIKPQYAQAWLNGATIAQTLGDYATANQFCTGLRRQDFLLWRICQSHLYSVTGSAAYSYGQLQNLSSMIPSYQKDLRIWLTVVLGDIATQLNYTDQAERHYQQALALSPDNTYLLGNYSDFLLQQNKPKRVKTLLKNKTHIDSLLLRLTLAEKTLNEKTYQKHIRTLKTRYQHYYRRGDIPHYREEIRFYLYLSHNPQRALRLAQQNWQNAKTPIDTRLLLEAAIAQQASAVILEVKRWLDKTQLEDKRIDALLRQEQG